MYTFKEFSKVQESALPAAGGKGVFIDENTSEISTLSMQLPVNIRGQKSK